MKKIIDILKKLFGIHSPSKWWDEDHYGDDRDER